MGLEKNNEQHYREVVDKFHDPAADYSMTVRDYVLRPTVAAAAIVITLPNVAEAKGRTYVVKPRGNTSVALTVTIQDQDESEGPGSDIVLTSNDQSVMLYSDGLTWHTRSATDLVGLLVAPLTAVTVGVHISGPWDKGYNTGAFLMAADSSGTALALGTSTTGWCFERINITAAATGSYIFGKYVTIATSAAMLDGFIMGEYVKVSIDHVAYENYAIRGRMCVNVAQSGDTANQFLGVFGAVEFAAAAHALLTTGGGYGVLGTASIAAGGTLDQPLIGGYFECNAESAIAGLTTAVRARMLGFCDFGLDVLCQTSEGIAGIRILTQDAAKLHYGIKFEASAVGGVSRINHAFCFLVADMSDGAYVAATAVTTPETAQGVIKIDCAGTDYYIPFYDAGDIDTEWADVDA